ncbi:coiled-coil domain-containing protein [Lacticaseibacillus songhuajiangensis]|jgi:chromosome segregation ATPase|uniref:coiled-coil domain-containing protein n=1 Tax=Lacticaseibacillus songhuajiangensis TaxID=1296539 RepID=UPI000F7762CC|nr:hypothetical protein [Lacticaseibacillus songhuajiangensis]
MKISKTWQKVCVGVLSLVVLLFAGYGVKTAADEFWGGHEAVEEINHNIDLLSGNLHQRNVELKNTKAALEKANTNNAKLEKELTEKQELLKKNENEIAFLHLKITQITNANNRLQDQLASDKLANDAKVKDLKGQIEKLQADNDAYTITINQLRADKKKAEDQVRELQIETGNQRNDIKDLNEKLEETKKDRDEYKQGKDDNDKLLEQAEKDARGTLKKTHDALDRNDIEGHWHNEDNQN